MVLSFHLRLARPVQLSLSANYEECSHVQKKGPKPDEHLFVSDNFFKPLFIHELFPRISVHISRE